MKTQKRQCKCLHCKEHFLPDYRHRERQRFCSKTDCRKARKRASQKAWLEKPSASTASTRFSGWSSRGGLPRRDRERGSPSGGDELLRCEIPEGQSLEGHQYRTHLRL